MLTDEEFDQWCLRLELPEPSKKLIQRIRTSPPARNVQSAEGNVSGRYPSRKMGMAIQFESDTLELPAVYDMEHDPDVLEYYDQPKRFKLTYPGKDNKRKVAALHTPDFFVMRRDRALFRECKFDEKLEELAKDMPNRYIRTDDVWTCPPGELYAAEFKLGYDLYTSSQISWVYQRNMHFLEDYLHPNTPAVPDELRIAIQTEVMKYPGIFLSDLLSHEEAGWVDAIYCLVLSDHIYADLYGFPFPEPEHVHLFVDRAAAQAFTTLSQGAVVGPRPQVLRLQVGSSFLWDGNLWTVLNVGTLATALRSEHNKLIDLSHEELDSLIQHGKISGLDPQSVEDADGGVAAPLMNADEADLKEASRRFTLMGTSRGATSDPSASSKSERTLQRYRRSFRLAALTHGNGYWGMFPRKKLRGNREKKLPVEVEDLMDNFICNDYESLTQQPKYEAYSVFHLKAQLAGLSIIPSYKTFLKRINQRPIREQTLKREGKRAANALEEWYWELEFTRPRHGDRPLEIGHIDHTQLDIELLSARTGKSLGRPWATFLMDAYTRRLLAIFLSFDPPSYRSCMMVMRECVWRYGRLPHTLVVDGGKEFHSIYFETLTAYYGCTTKTRPWAKPRFGSVCERLFGTANTQFVHNLAGNTQIMKRVRQVTKSIQPKKLAVWTLDDLYTNLCIWAYEVYDQNEHPALGQSPAEAYTLGLATSGERAHLRYDDTFRFLSLASTRKGTAKVQFGHGVKINYIYYNSRFLSLPGVPGSVVQVRYDPYDIGTAYAYVRGEWITLTSEHYAQLRGHTEREIQIAGSEIRKQYQNHGRGGAVTAKRLAAFLTGVHSYEAVLTQRLKDQDGRSVLGRMGGYLMSPVDPYKPAEPPVPESPADIGSDPTFSESDIASVQPDDPDDDLDLDFDSLRVFEEFN